MRVGTIFLAIFLFSSTATAQKMSTGASATRMAETYKMPEHDFMLFTIEGKKGFYTGIVNEFQLQHDANFAICCMGRIPQVSVRYYNKGYESGGIKIGSSSFASEVKKLTRRIDTLSNLTDYETQRKVLSARKDVYILEEETISYNKYFYVVFSDVDYPKEGRFYSKLSDMKKKQYKGEKVNYYFQGFERFPYENAKGEGLLELKLYYYDFPDELSNSDIFTLNDSRHIFGREYLLKQGWRKNSKYVLAWYEY